MRYDDDDGGGEISQEASFALRGRFLVKMASSSLL